jgi:predicted DNA repair protein MutK
MPGGLVALLDDIAALAKLAGASLDDVSAAAMRAGSKSAGVVIDDTAVTPQYVQGLSPDRELPIIGKIALGSLKNKLLFLLPAALLLSAFAPWAITPILMVGGAYLCFEGAEKVWHALGGGEHAAAVVEITDPKELEDRQVSGAVRTDFILSGEIMAIALSDLEGEPLLTQGVVLAVVGIAITAGVYGVVALIVKMDDVGLRMAKSTSGAARAIGRGLVAAMPKLLKALSIIGTAAMIWVGGGIIAHGLEVFGFDAIPHTIHHIAEVAAAASPVAQGVVEWVVGAIGAGVVGGIVGAAVVLGYHLYKKAKGGAGIAAH